MGIFSRKKTNAIQIDDVSQRPIPYVIGWDMLNPKKKGFKNFGEIYCWMALNQLYSGISNVAFEPDNDYQYNFTVKSICDFMESNASLIMSNLLYTGFIAVFYDNKGNYRLPYVNELRFDSFGRVINHSCVVIYSPLYQTKRKSLMMLVRPLLELIDTLANTLMSSCGTMGVLPIISGNSIPANPKFKQELADAMSKEFGWGDDQMKYFLSQQELKVDSIDLKVKDLELRDNIISQFKALLNYLEVPVDLVIGSSTYNNVEFARKYFYDSVIRKYAEMILKVARALLTASDEFITQTAINYRITNVAGIDRSISDRCAERNAYIDSLLKLQDAGIDVTDELEKVFGDLKHDYKII